MKKQYASSAKKEGKSSFKLSKKTLISIVILILVILVSIYAFAPKLASSNPVTNIVVNIYNILPFTNKVAATVGDKVIYQKTVDSIYKSLPAGSLTKEQILQRIIDTKVLLDYVENSGFAITDAQFQAEYQKELNASGLTKAQFEKSISASGATLDDLKDSLTIAYYVRTQIDPIIVIHPDQIDKYKQQNPTSNLTDAEIKTTLFKDARQQLIQAIIKLHQKSLVVSIN